MLIFCARRNTVLGLNACNSPRVNVFVGESSPPPLWLHRYKAPSRTSSISSLISSASWRRSVCSALNGNLLTVKMRLTILPSRLQSRLHGNMYVIQYDEQSPWRWHTHIHTQIVSSFGARTDWLWSEVSLQLVAYCEDFRYFVGWLYSVFV